RTCSPGTECIMISALNEARTAIETIREGAYDYLVKPISREELLLKVRHALDRKRLLRTLELNQSGLSPALAHPEAFSHIKTASPAMMRLLKEAELHAASDVPVLITGESGTGKELLAKAIHLASPRVSSTFTPVNMASLSSNFMDSDFFGHTRGAFTGAEKERAGYLESTDGGTLFLDEIGNLPLELQGKLLRVIQEGEFTKIGTNRLKRIDIRFIAATNEDMEKLTARGLFRKDLYYRLKGAWLHLPPLRKRKEDIPILAAKFLEDLSERAGEARIDEEALSALVNYDFPGNIRELKSIVTASLNIARGGTITPNCLPGHLKARKAASKQESIFCPHRELTIADVERVHILNTYRMTGGNKAKTAKILGTGLNTLRRKLESYGEK
ncbi:MAG: sigma-54 dependent transcriptional regulator, partial [Syntrophobacteraceae bacterium]